MHENSFIFRHSSHLAGVTALNAVMSDFSYEKHAHQELAIGVTLSGRQDFFCRGCWFQSPPGTILLFNPEDAHDGNPGNHDALKYTMLYLHQDEIVPLFHAIGKEENASLRLPETLFRDRILRSHILSLSHLISLQSGARMEQESLLYEIVKRLTQRLGHYQPDQWSERKDTLLLRVKEYILENLEQDLSIDELCGVATMSKYHFIRLFRRQFGITPHQYVLSARINRARRALEDGGAPSTVAHMSGFTDVSHLNRRFKRIHGITPRQYQIQFRG
ncbi:AraC family transcriptional regulator [Pseudodesulfovibrio piezophilus]|uniref:Transcriptional regulator, AraC family n=1 Tax=Pseudodesulfovibrio piezophilus (strain DSM 21447 / JCM 15486 / C1TLV30) TaxID=1322246 RepID=M1WSW9_PSEP2|nr:AraC family transcriptional regulator [Pseudodesulfovibrio piezophilus]CCH49152.1 Transcriptional regulator, AraC family [Pseudodesulfovibrio piezophilus C1TLV30]